eukprot:5306670-Ditylum_brightwellii.AAC.1
MDSCNTDTCYSAYTTAITAIACVAGASNSSVCQRFCRHIFRSSIFMLWRQQPAQRQQERS